MTTKPTILLITTTHLAKNPRLVKEIATLKAFYVIEVIFFQTSPEYGKFDELIINEHSEVKFHKINWLHRYYSSRFFYTIIQKLLIFLHRFLGVFILPEQQLFPGYLLLLNRINALNFDIVHGHNPGVLAAVFNSAKTKKKLCGFDAEDFHRGEFKESHPRRDLVIKIENKYLSKINLVLAASPLIRSIYIELYERLNIYTINNVFPKTQFSVKDRKPTNSLKLIWFSQFIGLDRGLNDVLKGIKEINGFSVEIYLYGQYTRGIKEELSRILSNTAHQVYFKGLISNNDLNLKLSDFDIGIASEPGKDLNNSIALSNKIFAYTQAGLAILASDTPAQEKYLATYVGIGELYQRNDSNSIKRILEKWYYDPESLQLCKNHSAKFALKEINWEKESEKLIIYFDKLLKTKSPPKLKIAITVDPEIPVPPTLYGGIERIVYLLVKELHIRGHEVTLFAHPLSKTSAKLVAWRGKRSPSFYDTLQNSFKLWSHYQKERYDVIHSFSRLAYLSPILNQNVAKVMSYQREPTLSQVKKARLFGNTHSLRFTGCSNYIADQLRAITPVTTVYNGINLSTYKFEPNVATDAPLVFLGRIEKIKGPHLAIELAKRSGKKLLIAGNIPELGRLYFDKEISPLLNENIQYIGPIDDQQKNKLLGKASALLMPILWDEPFGIVMIEAMACGTPVIGLNRGAVKEVIVEGENGYIGENMEDLAEAIQKISLIDRAFVRSYVEEHFSASIIVDQYLDVYRKTMRSCRENKKGS